MKRIILFASGSGSNVENIATYFKDRKDVEITAVFTNRKDAAVLDRCERLSMAAFYFNRQAFYSSALVMETLMCLQPDLIVLAGFLWKIPEGLVREFSGRMINIHPALLPKYGGKGMYGMHVHRAVHENRDAESGITIHYVNEKYDKGAIIHQSRTTIAPTDTAETIAHKVQELEYRDFPRVIEKLLQAL